MYKVIEVANMLNVSKVTIYKKMNQLKKELRPYVKKKKNITYIETEGIELIKSSLTQFIDDSHPAVSELTLKKLEEEKLSLEKNLDDKDSEIERIASNHIIELESQLEYLAQQIVLKKDVIKRKKETVEVFKLLTRKNKLSIDFIEELSLELNR